MHSRIVLRGLVIAVAAIAVVAGGLVAVPMLRGLLDRDGRPGAVTLGAAADTSTPFNLVSMPRLIATPADGHSLDVGRTLVSTSRYTRKAISYRGDGLRITGTMTFPRTTGPHPVVVSMHGYVPPGTYRRGRGLIREENAFATAGFAVLHPDYRNFGGSSRVTSSPKRPLGYASDVLNGIAALKRARLPQVDTSRMVLFGRSMGGGVAMQVAAARPRWFRALVLNSPVSSDAAHNFVRFETPALARRVQLKYGDPAAAARVMYDSSVEHWFPRIAAAGLPVRISHGTADRRCPISWSRQTTARMRADGVDVALRVYPGQRHRFGPVTWSRYIAGVIVFFGDRVS